MIPGVGLNERKFVGRRGEGGGGGEAYHLQHPVLQLDSEGSYGLAFITCQCTFFFEDNFRKYRS